MNIGFHNFAASPFASLDSDYNDSTNFDGAALRTGAGSSLRQRHMLQRAAEREREMATRLRENKQIERLNEQMNSTRDRIAMLEYEKLNGVKQTVEIGGVKVQKRVLMTKDEKQEATKRLDAMRSSLSFSNQQIEQIHRNRAQREELAIEREAQRQQLELEEQLREQEARAREAAEANQPEPQTEEELEQAIQNEATRSLTMISVRMDNIRSLSGTRARLQAEATMLENENDTSQARQEQWADIREGREIVAAAQLVDDVNAARNAAEKDRQQLDNARDYLNGHREKLAAGVGDIDRYNNAEAAYQEAKARHEKSRELLGQMTAMAGVVARGAGAISD
ncbi:MAG: hypothetical protein FWB91_13640, partial [Defluviitaleaceae bacterium]|nr:hypothetical protein [Defluviitaleaceae bacterium]